jgi:hypothetical protein
MLFKYCTGRCGQRLRSVPSFLQSGIAEPYTGARSVLITRGVGDGTDRRAPCETVARLHRRHETLTARNRLWHVWNRCPIQAAPATLHANVSFVHSSRLAGRLEMPSQSLLQLRPIILHPAPNGCVIDVETALLQKLLNIRQRRESRRYHRTAQRMRPDSVCRHLKIAGRVTISRFFHMTCQLPGSCNPSENGGSTRCRSKGQALGVHGTIGYLS